ncbi:hypothetical protein TPB0596_31150 [Tsukamurella pulmonis]|nr:hypothetical protein TPB0596_31150 [Tsukamurella pulmonis]
MSPSRGTRTEARRALSFVLPALIVLVGLLTHGLMVWQPWATPHADKVVTWKDPYGKNDSTVTCVSHKAEITCNWQG